MSAASKESFFDEMRERITLKGFAARASQIPSEKRADFAKRADVAREGRRAADVLWGAGSPAIALRTAKEAFVAQLDLARAIEGASIDAARFDALNQKLEQTDLPARDAEIGADHLALFDDIARAHRSLARDLEPYVSDDRAVRRKRVTRWANVSVVSLAVAVFLALVIQAQFRTTAVASGAYDQKHEAGNVLDAHLDSEWQLPDGQTGWLDLLLSPHRTVHRVRVVNGHNIIYNDRAVKDWRIELYSNGQMVQSREGTWDLVPHPGPGWTTIDFGSVPNVERVRIVVKSFHKNGAAIGEVRAE